MVYKLYLRDVTFGRNVQTEHVASIYHETLEYGWGEPLIGNTLLSIPFPAYYCLIIPTFHMVQMMYFIVIHSYCLLMEINY